MAAVEQDITAEQGAALAVTLTGAGASLQGRTLRMHVRSKVGVITTKLVASTGDGRLTVGGSPYTTATLAIGSDIMAAVSVTNPIEYWVYDVESYTTAADVRREWAGTFTISRDVTRDTEPDEEGRLAGLVRYDAEQTLSDAEKLIARTNIGAGTGTGGSGTGDVVGPASATDDRIAAFDGVTGKLIKQGTVTATAVASHLGSTSNPHSVTAAQVGADPAGTAAGAVSAHNSVTTAHGISAFGATLVDDADAATARTTLGLGTAATSASGDFAAASHTHAASAITSGTLAHERGGLEADVSAYSGLVKITGGATSAVAVTAAGEALLDDADASAQRTTLGLGGAAVLSVGTTAGTVAAGDDARLTDDRTASGLRETSGPTLLTLGAVADGEYLVRSGTTVVGGTPAGGGAGTKTFLVAGPRDNSPPASAFATLDTRNSIPVLDFDAAADERAIFSGVVPEGAILTGGIVVKIKFMATTATSGTVRLRVEFERTNTDQDADSFDTATEVTATTNATSGIETTAELTCTTIDGLVANDRFRCRVTRVGTDATNDTMTGDMELTAVHFELGTTATALANSKWYGAGEMIPRVTNGAGIGGQEFATNKINLDYLLFDPTTAEYAQWSFFWPGAYTTFTATVHWTSASGSGTTTWVFKARCYADGDALDQALGTGQSVTDTLILANGEQKSAPTSAVTPAGTVAAGNKTIVEIGRDVADTLGVDGALIGVMLEFA